MWHQEDIIVSYRSGDGYNSSGIFAFWNGEKAAINDWSHCSCFGTWDNGGYDNDGTFDHVRWEGSLGELLEHAHNMTDFSVPGRSIDPADYDYEKWKKFYSLVLECFDDGFNPKFFETES